MFDRWHNVEEKLRTMIQSFANIQTAWTKALPVDRPRLATAQADGHVLGAHRVLLDGYGTDVRPLLARRRNAIGVAADSVAAFRVGGYAEQRARECSVVAFDKAVTSGKH
jgi:L-rhamnose isomerase/sugar isomerase